MLEILNALGLNFSSGVASVVWLSFLVALFVGISIAVAKYWYIKGRKYGEKNPYPEWAERRDRLAKKIALTRHLFDQARDHQADASKIYKDLEGEWKNLAALVNYDEWAKVSHFDDSKVESEVEKHLSADEL